MPSDLAERLCLHASTLVDPATRVALFRSMLDGLTDEELRDAIDALTLRSAAGEPRARVALLSLQVALSASPDRQRRLVDGSAPASEDGTDPADDNARVPDYGRGRPLTLGERKSLARKPDRRMFDRVLRDPHPDVIALLLQNPRLTEPDVVRLCSRRPNVPEVLARVFGSPRWSLRPAVRRALAMNPASPPALTAAVLPLLGADDLRALRDDERTPLLVVRRCEELLAALEA